MTTSIGEDGIGESIPGKTQYIVLPKLKTHKKWGRI
jgi:hypothetical protein